MCCVFSSVYVVESTGRNQTLAHFNAIDGDHGDNGIVDLKVGRLYMEGDYSSFYRE